MSDSKPDFDEIFQSLRDRNEELDRKLDALLRPLGLTREDLVRVAGLANRVDPLVAKQVERVIQDRSAVGDVTWQELTRSAEPMPPADEASPVPAPYWVRA